MSGVSAPAPSRIIVDVDFDAAGKHCGRLFVPQSHNDSAWGAVAIPIMVARNGLGPTLLLVGGTHGDEYEGQIALLELAKTLDPTALSGRVIIVPALHYPACEAGTRTSPIDGRDLNRSFPGDPAGSFAQALAHYVASRLIPMCDVIVDLHSGGRSLDCLPSTMSHILDDAAILGRTVDLAKAFGAPFHVMNREVDGTQTFASTAERQGVIYMSSELGGGNRVSLDGLTIARRGIVNAMIHVGVLADRPQPPPVPTRPMIIPTSRDYGFAPAGGIYAPRVRLGESVRTGDLLGEIHRIDDPLAPPVSVRAARGGMLWCQRGQGRIAVGDCSAVIVSDWSPDEP
jgi:N-alpha-acetyl-L-2,4-diaminobutyrate deacetylase